MSFIVRPLPSILNPPALVCCVDGKTKTEAVPQDFSADFTEETIKNDDGTHTTTWTSVSASLGTTGFNFYLCCSSQVIIVWTSTEPSAIFNSPVLFEGNGESGYGGGTTVGGWTWDSDDDPFSSPSKPGLTMEELVSVCGTKVTFDLAPLGEGETITFAITY